MLIHNIPRKKHRVNPTIFPYCWSWGPFWNFHVHASGPSDGQIPSPGIYGHSQNPGGVSSADLKVKVNGNQPLVLLISQLMSGQWGSFNHGFNHETIWDMKWYNLIQVINDGWLSWLVLDYTEVIAYRIYWEWSQFIMGNPINQAV